MTSVFSLLSTRRARTCYWHEEKSSLRQKEVRRRAAGSFLHPQICVTSDAASVQ